MQAPLFSLPFVLLENRLDPEVAARLFTGPVDIVSCNDAAGIDESWDRVERGLANGLHAAGFFSFELGYCLEPKLRPLLPEPRTTPLFWLGLFSSVQRIGQCAMDEAFAALGPPAPIGEISQGLDIAAYIEQVDEILGRIAAGDVYQVNFTLPLRFCYSGDPLQLYAALRASQPVGHGAMIGLPEMSILSVSPELFISVDGRHATVRPMKGTVPRGTTGAKDAAASANLVADPKQRAENLMIVDLLRNDLSRIGVPGSVRVPDLFSVETFPTLHTMTSTVTAKLRSDVGPRNVVQALFPCGSVAGAPKHRAMEIIRSSEAAPRGIYTGAIGAIHSNGDLDLNVAIRTTAIDRDGRGVYGVGGGIVFDSDARTEWEECLLKARVLTDLAEDFGLIETLRWSPSTSFCRLEGHLDRLKKSSSSLGFVFDRAAVEAALASRIRLFGAGERRVRLVLRRDGAVDITSAMLPLAPAIARVSMSAVRLDAGDPFLRHKTTRRRHYEAAFAAAAAQGADEALLLNNHGDIADASHNSVFVERSGILLTPPLASGALAGVLRNSLLETGEARECRLALADLSEAPRWFLGNSLHGLRQARLTETIESSVFES